MSAVLRAAIPVALLATLAFAAPAAAQLPGEVIGPYAGEIQFRCQLQDVGTGTDFPDPNADPFCVEYDKTNQNITGLGIIEFLLQEPARLVIAVRKCFYHQRDHWTGSVVQGSAPELYHWDGDYWFDIARGVGGVSLRNLRVGGVPLDATPFVPEAYRPFFDPNGGGGVMVELATNPPSHCTSRVDTPAERDAIYAGTPEFVGCRPPGGKLAGRRVGRVRLGMRRSQVVGRLGIPGDHKRGVDRWCLIGKGDLRVAYTGRDGGRAILIRSSSRGHAARGVARGDRARRAKRRLRLQRRLRVGGATVFEGPRTPARRLFVAIEKRRVRWVAIVDRDAARGKARKLLARAD